MLISTLPHLHQKEEETNVKKVLHYSIITLAFIMSCAPKCNGEATTAEVITAGTCNHQHCHQKEIVDKYRGN